MTDVNQQFAEAKLDQMAKATDKRAWLDDQLNTGKMTAMGNSAYRVNTGWDSGEIITINAQTLSAEGLHGLDVNAAGDVALYSRAPAWHGMGTIVPAGLTSVSGVLKAGGLDWTVALKPSPFLNHLTGEWTDKPNRFDTFREDNGTWLGEVGKVYTPAQNHEAFDFLETVFGDHHYLPETAGSMDGGRKVFISAQAPEGMIVDPDGIADETRLYLVIANSHDGSGGIRVHVTPWRPVCKNTERFALRDAAYRISIRHTKNWKEKLAQAQKTLKISAAYRDAWVAEETSLVQTSFTADDLDALITEVWGELPEDASKRAVTLDEHRRVDVRERFGTESGRVGRNAFAAERAITGSVDHFTVLRPSSASLRGADGKVNRLAALGAALLEESNTLDERKSRAHKALLTWTNR